MTSVQLKYRILSTVILFDLKANCASECLVIYSCAHFLWRIVDVITLHASDPANLEMWIFNGNMLLNTGAEKLVFFRLFGIVRGRELLISSLYRLMYCLTTYFVAIICFNCWNWLWSVRVDGNVDLQCGKTLFSAVNSREFRTYDRHFRFRFWSE